MREVPLMLRLHLVAPRPIQHSDSKKHSAPYPKLEMFPLILPILTRNDTRGH